MLMVAWQNIEGELSTSQFWEKIDMDTNKVSPIKSMSVPCT